MANPEKRREISNRHSKTEKCKRTLVKNWLASKYNLTEEQYQDLWDKQEGLCAVCGREEEETNQRLHVDHNHTDNVVRGLLCGKCNRGIGMFNEEEPLLQKAIDYLRSHK